MITESYGHLDYSDGIDYSPVVPISLGSIQFCGPLSTLHYVNEILTQLVNIDELIYQGEHYDNEVEVLYAKHCPN